MQLQERNARREAGDGDPDKKDLEVRLDDLGDVGGGEAKDCNREDGNNKRQRGPVLHSRRGRGT